MLISYQREFYFVHVYKTEGTSVGTVLEPYVNWLNGRRMWWLSTRLQIPHSAAKWCGIFSAHISAGGLKQMLPAAVFKDFFKFAFVRNRRDLQASPYHFARQQPIHFRYEEIKRLA